MSIFFHFFLPMLWACAPKMHTHAQGPMIGVVALYSITEAPTVEGLMPTPDLLVQAIGDALAARKLYLQPDEADASLAQRRDPELRRAWLHEQWDGQMPTALVEVAPSRFARIQGRTRWTVSVRITLLTPDNPPLSTAVSVPIFLRFPHEGEAQAVEAAASRIANELGILVDGWLATQ
jgi:hypothetical protein